MALTVVCGEEDEVEGGRQHELRHLAFEQLGAGLHAIILASSHVHTDKTCVSTPKSSQEII